MTPNILKSPLLACRVVPIRTYLLAGSISIRYKKLIEHRPGDAMPKVNIRNVVTFRFVERKRPMNTIDCSARENIITGLLP